MSVKTFACTFSASAIRAFHAASLRLTRPMSMAGFFALESSCAALAIAASSGCTGSGGRPSDAGASGFGATKGFVGSAAASNVLSLIRRFFSRIVSRSSLASFITSPT